MQNEKEWHQRIEGMIQKASGIELELVWIPKIMARQTQDERNTESTIELNKVGLNCYDAGFISSLYTRIQNGAHLTDKQIQAARRTLGKYWKQYAGMMVNIQSRAQVS